MLACRCRAELLRNGMAREICGSGCALVAAGALMAACGGGSSAAPSARGAPPPRPAPVRDAVARPAASTYASPVGMWLPSQMPRHTALLRKLGIDIDPALLSDPSSPLLQAVVDLSGCSASFVSPEGLIVTSHRCARSALEYHSTPQNNLLDAGFLARTRGDEKWAGPSARALVTRKVEDVTRAMTDGLDAIADDSARQAEIEARQKRLVAECEGARAHVRCQVSALDGGAEWVRTQSLEIRDVRLVYAPPAAIGHFGGDQDSGTWPRHAGDFAFYRAYVGSDGVPADHSPRNIPYQSKHRLRIASKPLRDGDLVVVAGFPRATSRHATAAELDERVTWEAPRLVSHHEAALAALRAIAQRDPEAQVAAQPLIDAMGGAIKRARSLQAGLRASGAVDRRRRHEAALAHWIWRDPERRRRWGRLLSELDRLQADRRGTRERDAAFAELHRSQLFSAATAIVRMAEERRVPDAGRDAEFQDRSWKRIDARLLEMERRYHRSVDAVLVRVALERAARELDYNQAWLERVLDRRAMAAVASGDEEAVRREIDRVVRRLYAGSRLERADARRALLRDATSEQLARSQDPMIRLAVALRPVEKEIEEQRDRLAGAAALVRPRYAAAMRAFTGEQNAADADGTLRIAFGTVRGLRAGPDGALVRAFTTLREAVARHRDAPPFDLPDALVAASSAELGPYRDHKLDDVPVDFTSDVDTSEGNSGSATLNGRGELCGLAIAQTVDSAVADRSIAPESQRTIHVDLRYAAWVLDAVADGDHILAEMGVTPSL
jgi:Peptidase S46